MSVTVRSDSYGGAEAGAVVHRTGKRACRLPRAAHPNWHNLFRTVTRNSSDSGSFDHGGRSASDGTDSSRVSRIKRTEEVTHGDPTETTATGNPKGTRATERAYVMGVRTWIDSWPVYRQLKGTDPLGRGAAAKSGRSARLTPRVASAGRVVKSICPYCAVGCVRTSTSRTAASPRSRATPTRPSPEAACTPRARPACECLKTSVTQEGACSLYLH